MTGESPYTLASLDRERRVVYKAEALVKGPNTRYTRVVVTTQTDPPLDVDDFSVDWGTPEQWIDQLKATCFADRLSCCDFWPSQFLWPILARYRGLRE